MRWGGSLGGASRRSRVGGDDERTASGGVVHGFNYSEKAAELARLAAVSAREPNWWDNGCGTSSPLRAGPHCFHGGKHGLNLPIAPVQPLFLLILLKDGL